MAVQDHDSCEAEDQLPLIGIYHCLLCGHRFSTKLQLKLHYKVHASSIPDYTHENIIQL